MKLTLEEKNIIKQIKKLSNHFYSQQDFAHDQKHAMRVTTYSKNIMKFEKANPFLVLAGAWLHQFHDNLEELDEILKQLPINDQTKEQISHIVEVCCPNKIYKSQSMEAKIVYDADALAVISSYGLIRELICNAIARKLTWEDNVKETQKVQKIFIDSLQTAGAKQIAKSTTEICKNFWNDYKHWESIA